MMGKNRQKHKKTGWNFSNDEELFRGKIIHMIAEIEPDNMQMERIWEQTVAGNGKSIQKDYTSVRAACIVIGMLLLGLFGTVSVNAATDGAFFESIRKLCGLSEHQQQVAEETIALPNDVYAPNLAACSMKYIVFANERGLMVYERKIAELVATLDLQAIDCNYFNADTIETCIFMEDDILYIFNREISGKNEPDKNGKFRKEDFPGAVYTYQLSIAGKTEALDIIEDRKQIKGIQEKWTNYEISNIHRTFDEMQGKILDLNELTDKNAVYSENCIKWTDETGEEQESFLIVTEDDEYTLCTCSLADKTLDKQEIAIETVAESGQNTDEGLPVFQYSGEDKILRALCEEIISGENMYDVEGGVLIPAPVIHAVVNEGDDVIVFCNLWNFTYYQNGNTLNCEGGGEQPSRIKLIPDEKGGYKVSEHLTAGDGEQYSIDIKEFCKGYGVSPDIYYDKNSGLEQIRKELISMYVKNNGINIKYYKDYGWDPIEIGF